MKDAIIDRVNDIPTLGFFVTVDFIKTSEYMPKGIEEFILEKLSLIRKGVSGRRFTFEADGWRMHFTFFPTDSVVDPKYAMMNNVVKNKL